MTSLMQLSPSTLRQHVLSFAVRAERASGVKSEYLGRMDLFTATCAGFVQVRDWDLATHDMEDSSKPTNRNPSPAKDEGFLCSGDFPRTSFPLYFGDLTVHRNVEASSSLCIGEESGLDIFIGSVDLRQDIRR